MGRLEQFAAFTSSLFLRSVTPEGGGVGPAGHFLGPFFGWKKLWTPILWVPRGPSPPGGYLRPPLGGSRTDPLPGFKKKPASSGSCSCFPAPGQRQGWWGGSHNSFLFSNHIFRCWRSSAVLPSHPPSAAFFLFDRPHQALTFGLKSTQSHQIPSTVF